MPELRHSRRRASPRLVGGVAVAALLSALAVAAPAGARTPPGGQTATPTGTPAPARTAPAPTAPARTAPAPTAQAPTAPAPTGTAATTRGSVTGAAPASPVPAQPRFTG